MDYVVRQLASGDVRESHSAQFSRLTSQLCGREVVFSLGDVRRICEAHILAVAHESSSPNSIQGMACLVVMELPQGKRFLIESMVVDQAHKRRGIGHLILQFLASEVEARGGSHVSLTCNPSRQDAEQLYRSQGFLIADTNVWRLSIGGQKKVS